MDPSTLRAAAERLRQVTQDHAEWHGDLLRSIFCGLPARTADLAADAHRTCPFGAWYYGDAPDAFRDYPNFLAIGAEHERLHRLAAQMLRSVQLELAISREEFEELVATSARMREEIDALGTGIEAALFDRDALTGAQGRSSLLPELHECRALVKRGGRPCSIVFADVDHLGAINDLHGHAVGDAVLVSLVRHLHAHLRGCDRVFRYGGDEFLIALPGADLASAQAIIARVRAALGEQRLVVGPDGATLTITASFGLALLDPAAGVLDSIGRADQALLLAKAAGRNRAICWDASITTSTRWRRIRIDEVR